MFQPRLFKGKRILVTGGGTGLGREMADRFLELGADIHICGRRKEVLDRTAQELMQARGAYYGMVLRQMESASEAQRESILS